jgi:hypothetical protein
VTFLLPPIKPSRLAALARAIGLWGMLFRLEPRSSIYGQHHYSHGSTGCATSVQFERDEQIWTVVTACRVSAGSHTRAAAQAHGSPRRSRRVRKFGRGDLQGNRAGGRKAWLATGPGRRTGDGRFTPLPDRLEQEARPTERLHPREELSICPAANISSDGAAEPLQSSAIQRR